MLIESPQRRIFVNTDHIVGIELITGHPTDDTYEIRMYLSNGHKLAWAEYLIITQALEEYNRLANKIFN